MLDRRDRHLHNERIAAGATMTFEHLVRFFGYLDDVAVIDSGNAHPDERRDGQANLGRIDLGAIARDDLGIFELAYSFNYGRRGQTDPAAKLGIARTGIFLKLF